MEEIGAIVDVTSSNSGRSSTNSSRASSDLVDHPQEVTVEVIPQTVTEIIYLGDDKDNSDSGGGGGGEVESYVHWDDDDDDRITADPDLYDEVDLVGVDGEVGGGIDVATAAVLGGGTFIALDHGGTYRHAQIVHDEVSQQQFVLLSGPALTATGALAVQQDDDVPEYVNMNTVYLDNVDIGGNTVVSALDLPSAAGAVLTLPGTRLVHHQSVLGAALETNGALIAEYDDSVAVVDGDDECTATTVVADTALLAGADAQSHTQTDATTYPANLYNRTSTHTKPTVKFTCDKCGLVLDNGVELLAHKRSHGTTMLYACNKCDQEFPSTKLVTVHLRQEHSQKKVKDLPAPVKMVTAMATKPAGPSAMQKPPTLVAVKKRRRPAKKTTMVVTATTTAPVVVVANQAKVKKV